MERDLIEIFFIEDEVNVNEENRRRIDVAANYIFQMLSDMNTRHERIKITIRMYGDYFEFTNSQDEDSTPKTDKGFYSSGRNEILINGKRDIEDILKTVNHELTHFCLNMINPKIPAWIQEGLAEYFEELFIVGDSVGVGIQEWRVKDLKKWGDAGELMTIYDSTHRPNHIWLKLSSQGKQQPRSISWSLFYFLMRDERGRSSVFRLLSEYGKNRKYEFEEWLEILAPNNDLEQLEQEWKNFVIYRLPDGIATEVQQDD